MWVRRCGGERLPGALAVLALAGCLGGEEPEFVDVPRVSEALREHQEGLEASCGEGFPGFLGAARQVVAGLEGSARFLEAIDAFRRPGGGLRATQLPEPALFRLLLHRYGTICRGPAALERARRLAELAEADGAEGAAELRELIERSVELGPGGHLRSPPPSGASALVLDLSRTEAGAEGSAPLVLLACLRCRAGSPVEGARQVASALAALEAVAASQLLLAHPVELVICLDSSSKPQGCAEGALSPSDPVTAALALDGTEPLVVSWSAEVSWHLALPHVSPDQRWLDQARRSPSKGAGHLLLLAAEAVGSIDELPAEAWMELFDPAEEPRALARSVEAQAAELAKTREAARYSVEALPDRVKVIARAKAMPAWQISERQSSLWDLAALARALRVTDPPGGGLAAMLRAVQRFDGDPNGARLGLHYEDPIGGPLLVAPTSLVARDGQAILAIRMYRPPGLERRDFVSRLLEARDRLRFATSRPLVVAESDVGDPSRVAPDAELVRVVQRALVEVADLDEPPTPGGSPRPGLGVLLPDAVSIRLPTEPTRLDSAPAISLILELIWQLDVATTPALRRASSWE